MLILVSLAYLLSIELAVFISPYFVSLTGDDFAVISAHGLPVLVTGWGIALLVGLLAAAYPIHSMVHGKVIDSLRSIPGSVAGGGSRLRFILLTLQSLCGLGLTFVAGVIYFQISSLEHADKGFDANGLLYIHLWGEDPKTRNSSQSLVAALRQVNGVENATLVYSANPLQFRIRERNFNHPETHEVVRVATTWVGDQFRETMKIPLVEGRIFAAPPSPDEGAPGPTVENVFVNERFIKDFQLGSATEALGTCLYYITEGERSKVCRRITAVVGNHYQMLDENPVTAVVFVPTRSNDIYNLIVRYEPEHEKEIFSEIEKVWDDFSPDNSIYYNYLDDIILKDISAQRAIAMLVVITALGSLLLTVAGLYAMAKFFVARRGREIAIRRVLGASTMDIVRLMGTQLSKPVILGGFIGLPIGWHYAMDWLQAYAIRIQPEIWHAVVVGIVGVVFFVTTTTAEILRAVRIRPAKALHYE